jgi:phosphatidate cytidylyltransferase
MLKDRVLSGALIGFAFVAATLWIPVGGALAILLVVCALAMLEFYALLEAAKIPHFRYFGLLSGLVLILATWYPLRHRNVQICDVEWMVLCGITIAVFLRQFPQKNNPQPLETIAGTLMGVIYVSFLLSFFAKLLLSWNDDHVGRLLILFLILVVKAADMGAYFVGCSIGRHKLLPRISPAKTWEGFFGGLLSSVLVSLLFYALARHRLAPLTMHLSDALMLGVMLGTIGTVSDLTESLFKRGAGVKDSGRMILGMGGILDVIDSLLFSAPALYVYARFFL